MAQRIEKPSSCFSNVLSQVGVPIDQVDRHSFPSFGSTFSGWVIVGDTKLKVGDFPRPVSIEKLQKSHS